MCGGVRCITRVGATCCQTCDVGERRRIDEATVLSNVAEFAVGELEPTSLCMTGCLSV